MDLNERDQSAFKIVDEALQTFPFEPAPQNLLSGVMKRIDVQQSAPKFSLSWLDYALSIFIAGMVGVIWGFLQGISLPPNWREQVHSDLLLWWYQFRLILLSFHPAGMIILAIFMLLLAVGILFLFCRRPSYYS